MRPLVLISVLLLTACSPEVAAPVMVEAEPVFVEPEMSSGLTGATCLPGDDDGIGGTGCPVN